MHCFKVTQLLFGPNTGTTLQGGGNSPFEVVYDWSTLHTDFFPVRRVYSFEHKVCKDDTLKTIEV